MPEAQDKKILKHFIIDSIDKLWKLYEKNLRKTSEKFSEESVHDLRVTIRRFLAWLELLEALFPSSYVKQARKVFRKQIKIFNPLRDTQVQLINVQDMLKEFPFLISYQNFLINKEKDLIEKLKTGLKQFEKDDIEGMLFFIKMNVKQNIQKYDIDLKAFFLYAHNAFQYMFYLYKIADTHGLDTIHRVRLAFKKFRYIMEILQSLSDFNFNLKAMKGFQTILGNIQDNRVLVIDLHFFLEEEGDVTAEQAFSIENEILKQRNSLIKQFLQQRELIESFWNSEYLPKLKKTSSKD